MNVWSWHPALLVIWFSSPVWIFFFSWLLWRPHHEKTPFGAQVTHFDPPEEFSPIEAKLLLERTLSQSSLFSVLFDLGQRGYVLVKDGRVRRLKALDDPGLKTFEAYFYKKLFPEGEEEFPAAVLRERVFVGINGHGFTKGVFDSLARGGYISGKTFNAAMACSLTGVGLVIFGMRSLTTVALFPFAVVALIDGAILIVSARGWVSWTKKGRLAADHLRGYRHFLRKIVPDQALPIEAMQKFGRHLAYAYAFGLGRKWRGRLSDDQGGDIPRF